MSAQYVVVTHYAPNPSRRPVVHVWGPYPTRSKAASAVARMRRADRHDYPDTADRGELPRLRDPAVTPLALALALAAVLTVTAVCGRWARRSTAAGVVTVVGLFTVAALTAALVGALVGAPMTGAGR